MLVSKSVQLAVLAVTALLWESRTDAATSTFKLCGRKLSDFMSNVCQVYNSPSWDTPTVVEQPAGLVRRRRQAGGIADACCNDGCTWALISEYCLVRANAATLLKNLDTHLIADRSAEQEAVVSPAVLSESTVQDGAREVGRRSGGYERVRVRGRRRCTCRRARRDGRHRAAFMGNMDLVRNAARAAPVVGTVSPLLTWGRTLHTDLPQEERDRYAYVSVYTT